MTHVAINEDFISATGIKPLNGDDIGYVESYDFSKANMSQESRIAAITTVASVCYANPKALGSISLYNRLATESKGLPSSSYEFVPVLIKHDNNTYDRLTGTNECTEGYLFDTYRYGELVEGELYLLTNLRALISDVGEDADKFFNTEEECAIIAKHFKVFKSKIDLSTARQFMRHRASWQELSRRYVSGKKAEFEFYISDKLGNLPNSYCNENEDDSIDGGDYITIQSIINQAIAGYTYAIESGIKPEEARRILPQAMYTTVWSAWQPKQFEVFHKLRCDNHAQAEIRELAYAMTDLNPDFILPKGES